MDSWSRAGPNGSEGCNANYPKLSDGTKYIHMLQKYRTGSG